MPFEMKTKPSEPHQFRRKWDDSTVVWLDCGRTESADVAQESQVQDSRTTHSARIFTNSEECLAFLRAETDAGKILLILKHDEPHDFVNEVHHLPQIHSIYMIGPQRSDPIMHHRWKMRYPKLHGAFQDMEAIREHSNSEQPIIQSHTTSEISISVASVTDGLSETNNAQDASFMYAEILKEIFVEMNYPEDVHKEFVAWYRKRSPDSSFAEKELIVFEDEYHSRSAIEWYTRTRPVYKSLNNALRTNDVITLYQMRFLIKHIHEQLQQIQSFPTKVFPTRNIRLYRGVTLTDADFTSIQKNIGGLLSINAFWSTSLKCNVAKVFAALDRPESTHDRHSVLFEMDVDTDITRIPFASIEHISRFPDEEEVLFSMGTVFRINSVQNPEQRGPREWLVSLTLIEEKDPQLRRLSKDIKNLNNAPHPLARLAKLLHDMGKYNESSDIYRILLGDLRTERDWPLLAMCYADMGTNYHCKSEVNDAREMYERALEIHTKYLNVEDQRCASLYNNLGGLQYDQGDYTSALSNGNRALEILMRTNELEPRTVAAYMNNLGTILQKLDRNEEAQEKFERALKINEKCLDPNDPALAALVFNIGSTHLEQNQLQEAYEKYERALKIRERSLVGSHPEIASSYLAMSHVLFKLERYSEAMAYAEKAVSLFHRNSIQKGPEVESAEALLRILRAKRFIVDKLFKKPS